MVKDNSYANAARLEKCTRLFSLCVRWDLRSYDIAGFSDASWGLLIDAANVEKRKEEDPAAKVMGFPSEEAQGIVIRMLKDREMAGVPQYAQERR